MKFSTLVCMLASVVASTNAAKSHVTPQGFPSPLTLDNFKTKLSHGLHLVEFYSPYCSHCLHFAPTWEDTWDAFHEEGDVLGIAMAQVDCVSSGDLCNKEKITAYPSLKLYGPQGFIKNYPKTGKRKQEGLIKFMRDSVVQLGDPNFHVESKSKPVSAGQMVEILGEVQEQPYLISFWPSYTLESLDEYNVDKFDTRYDEECLDLQKTWSIVSNQVESLGMKAVHFNCLSNDKMCHQLGLERERPHVGIVLPGKRVAKLIIMDGDKFDLTVKEIIDFATRTAQVSKMEDISLNELTEMVASRLPYLDHFPTEAETIFVYLYDDETVSEEDFELFPYLVEPLSKLPNTKIFKSNDTNIMHLVKAQMSNIYSDVNYNSSEPERSFNETRYLIETATSYPTLLAFSNVLQWPHVYHSMGPYEIRDQYKVIDWLNDRSAPAYIEFNMDTYEKFIKGGDDNERVVLLFVDPTKEQVNLKYQSQFLVGVHDYADLRDEARFEQVLKEREEKHSKIKKLKEKNEVSKKITEVELKEVHYGTSGELTLGWVDINKDPELLTFLGINTNDRTHQAGDVLVIEMFKEVYYEHDTFGQLLNVRESPYALRRLLTSLAGITNDRVTPMKRHSWFSSQWRWVDDVLDVFSKWTVIICVVVVVGLIRCRPKMRATHLGWGHRDSRGILGNPEAKAD